MCDARADWRRSLACEIEIEIEILGRFEIGNFEVSLVFLPKTTKINSAKHKTIARIACQSKWAKINITFKQIFASPLCAFAADACCKSRHLSAAAAAAKSVASVAALRAHLRAPAARQTDELRVIIGRRSGRLFAQVSGGGGGANF